MFIISLEYIKPLTEVEKHLEAHRAYLAGYFERNKLICIGRKEPRTGGVIVACNMDRAGAEALIADDPFKISGVAAYEITEVVPTRWAEQVKSILE